METSALRLIGEAIDALTRADAARLEHLQTEMPRARRPASAEERQAVAGKRLALLHLLALTSRNLRVLRAPGHSADAYGTERG
jgi:hypothetical protein